MDQKNFITEFENTIRLITDLFPSAETLIKPTLFHSIRVGIYLYEREYSRDICLAALLHDTLEDTSFTLHDIEKKFGDRIAELVMANTKDMSVEKSQRSEELIKRCAAHSEDALIVKAADIRDNIMYYTRIGNADELEHMKRNARFVIQYKSEKYTDSIFEELRAILLA